MSNTISSVGQPPINIFDFAKRVRIANVTCDCDQCQPQRYHSGACGNAHETIPQRHWLISWIRGPIQPKLKHNHVYGALHLARASMQYFTKATKDMTPMQQDALKRFERLKSSRESTLSKLGWKDGARALACHRVLSIINIYNDLFFFGAVKMDFQWRELEPNLLAWYLPDDGLIELSPWATDTGTLSCTTNSTTTCEARTIDRLGTLLHEVVHAYLSQFACGQCPTDDVNLSNAAGHGRAFQLIAIALEQVSQAIFGMQINVSSVSDYIANWHDVRHPPSMHDASQWKWFVDKHPEL